MKTWRVLLALVVGLGVGALISVGGGAWTSVLPFTDAVGTIWINAIRMTVIPLIVSITITGVASSGEGVKIGRLGVTAFVTVTALLVAGGFFAVLIAPPLLGTPSFSPDAVASLRSGLVAAPITAQVPSFHQRIIDFVPSNVVKAAADG